MGTLNIALVIAYPLAILLIAYLLLKKSTLRVFREGVFIGLGYMLLAIIIEYILQEVVNVLVVIHVVGFNILNIMTLARNTTSLSTLLGTLTSFIRQNLPWIAVAMGLIAAVCQETARYFAVKDRDPAYAASIGLGFSIVDTAILIMTGIIGSMAPRYIISTMNTQSLATLAAISVVAFLLNTPISILFHVGVSIYMRHMQLSQRPLRGFTVALATHTYLDSLTVYLNGAAEYAALNIGELYYMSIVGLASILIISASIFYIGYMRARVHYI